MSRGLSPNGVRLNELIQASRQIALHSFNGPGVPACRITRTSSMFWVPRHRLVVRNRVTDPYSISHIANSKRAASLPTLDDQR